MHRINNTTTPYRMLMNSQFHMHTHHHTGLDGSISCLSSFYFTFIVSFLLLIKCLFQQETLSMYEHILLDSHLLCLSRIFCPVVGGCYRNLFVLNKFYSIRNGISRKCLLILAQAFFAFENPKNTILK